jgi:beta-lactamase class A
VTGRACLALAAFFLAGPARAAPLQDEVAGLTAGQPGTFAVYAARLGRAPEACLNCDEPINAASTIKLFVLDAAYAAFRADTLKPDETIAVHNRFHSLVGTRDFSLDQKEDSYDPLYAEAGKPVSVTELLRVMIQYSSNLATNLMVERLGVPFIRDVVARQDLQGIVFGRMIEDFDANAQGIRNRVTARGLGGFMQKLAQDRIVDPAASEAMIAILLGQTFNNVISPGLPPGTPVAHKTGWVTGVRNDAAIVFPPDGRSYILVELSHDLPDDAAGLKRLNAISAAVYAGFEKSGG